MAGLKHEGKGPDLARRSELRTKYRDFEKSIRTVRRRNYHILPYPTLKLKLAP